ncbi:MAG: CHASE domain-containing protein [Nitrosarchaeum sp.]
MYNKYLPWIALGISFVVTIVFWSMVDNLETQKEKLEFENNTEKLTHSIRDKLTQYSALISGAKGFYAASKLIEPDEWKSFVEVQNIKENYPGILGMGFIKHLEDEDGIASLIQFMSEYDEDFKIWPEGKRDEYYPILYLEPRDFRNQRAIGYDIYSEPVRREAAEFAELTGKTVMTGKLTLVQETDKDVQFGFLLLQPVYLNNASIQTEQDRRDNINGFVYSVFRINDFMNSFLDPSLLQHVSLTIYDGPVDPQNMFFTTEQHSNPTMSKTTMISFGEKTWYLVYQNFKQPLLVDILLPNLILIGGFSVSILLFFVFYYVNKNNQLHQEKIKTEKFTAIGELTARLAHDLRNPLSVINNSVELMKMKIDKNDEKLSRYVKMIETSVSNMRAQIDYTLNYAKTKKPTLVSQSLLGIIQQSYANSECPKNVKITLPTKDIVISCDKEQLLIVFNNLISNAIQAIGKNEGTITISLSDKNDHVIINFEDSGSGIPKESLEKIFEPLFTTKSQGIGLGLVSCKNIIEQHKGTISVKNNPTTFSIKLPKKQ